MKPLTFKVSRLKLTCVYLPLGLLLLSDLLRVSFSLAIGMAALPVGMKEEVRVSEVGEAVDQHHVCDYYSQRHIMPLLYKPMSGLNHSYVF